MELLNPCFEIKNILLSKFHLLNLNQSICLYGLASCFELNSQNFQLIVQVLSMLLLLGFNSQVLYGIMCSILSPRHRTMASYPFFPGYRSHGLRGLVATLLSAKSLPVYNDLRLYVCSINLFKAYIGLNAVMGYHSAMIVNHDTEKYSV